MEFSLTTPALLFPAISLLFLAYTSRFLTLANLARSLYEKYEIKPEIKLAKQITSLKYRIRIIKNMQILGVAAFFFCVMTMLFLFLGLVLIGEIIFGLSLLLLLISLAFSVQELRVSIDALEIQLAINDNDTITDLK